MRVYKFLQPYRGKKTAFPETKKKTGVYLIKEDGALVYVGYSQTDLYKTMYRHFQVWNDKKQRRVTYDTTTNHYTVRIIYCTAQQAVNLEAALIIKLKPRDNDNSFDDWEIDARDKALLSKYKETIVEQEAPF